MIIHPDGRLEGTPEELAAYQRAKKAAAPAVIERIVERPVYVPWVQPTTTPINPLPWTEITCGATTYDGPPIEVGYNQ